MLPEAPILDIRDLVEEAISHNDWDFYHCGLCRVV